MKPKLLIASLNPSSELLVSSIVIVAEAVPTVTLIDPVSSAEVVDAYPPEISLLSVAKLLTLREYVPEDAELVVVISITLLLSEELLFEKTLLLTINRLLQNMDYD